MPPKKQKLTSYASGPIIGPNGIFAYYIILPTVDVESIEAMVTEPGEPLRFARKSHGGDRRLGGNKGVEIWSGTAWQPLDKAFASKIASYRFVGEHGHKRVLGVLFKNLGPDYPPLIVFVKSVDEHDSQTRVAREIDINRIYELVQPLISLLDGLGPDLTHPSSPQASSSSSSVASDESFSSIVSRMPSEYLQMLVKDLEDEVQHISNKEKIFDSCSQNLLKAYEKLSEKTKERNAELSQAYARLLVLVQAPSSSSPHTSSTSSSASVCSSSSKSAESAKKKEKSKVSTAPDSVLQVQQIVIEVLNEILDLRKTLFLKALERSKVDWVKIKETPSVFPNCATTFQKIQAKQAKEQFAGAVIKLIKDSATEITKLRFVLKSAHLGHDAASIEGTFRKVSALVDHEPIQAMVEKGFFQFMADEAGITVEYLFRAGHVITLSYLKGAFTILNPPPDSDIPVVPKKLFDALPSPQQYLGRPAILDLRLDNELKPWIQPKDEAAMQAYMTAARKSGSKEIVTPFIMKALSDLIANPAYDFLNLKKIPLFANVWSTIEFALPLIQKLAGRSNFYSPNKITSLLNAEGLNKAWHEHEPNLNIATLPIIIGDQVGGAMMIDSNLFLRKALNMALDNQIVVCPMLVNFHRWVTVILLVRDDVQNSEHASLHVFIEDPLQDDIALIKAMIDSKVSDANIHFASEPVPFHMGSVWHDLGVKLTDNPDDSGPFVVDVARILLKILNVAKSPECAGHMQESLERLKMFPASLIRNNHETGQLCFSPSSYTEDMMPSEDTGSSFAKDESKIAGEQNGNTFSWSNVLGWLNPLRWFELPAMSGSSEDFIQGEKALWYDNEQVDAPLNTMTTSPLTHAHHLIQSMGAAPIGAAVGSDTFNYGFDLIGHAVSQAMQEFHPIVMVPVNLNHNHWVGAAIVIDNGVLHVLHHDPLTGEIHPDLLSSLQGFAESNHITYQIHDYNVISQTDSHSCGPFVVEDLHILALLLQGGIPEYDTVTTHLQSVAAILNNPETHSEHIAEVHAGGQFLYSPGVLSQTPSVLAQEPPVTTAAMPLYTSLLGQGSAFASVLQ